MCQLKDNDTLALSQSIPNTHLMLSDGYQLNLHKRANLRDDDFPIFLHLG
jgi:hypothetical protein